MKCNEVMLLDCTLRDGGYINEWKWGYQTACSIISELVQSGIDIIEVGFLRNDTAYNPDITVCKTIEELNRLLPENDGKVIYAAMAMQSNYDIQHLQNYCGNGIELIRITAHDYDIKEGLEFAYKVKMKGYKVSINPINIMGYADEQILWILKQVNQIQPYQFSIVDTFGSMKQKDLDRIVSLIDNNLDCTIRVGLHLHENMSLACCLAQSFINKRLNRPITIDASLMGMGRVPGNLPIELIADYLNDYTEKYYDIDYMLDAIQEYIAPLKGESTWGYTPAYFLSAKFNLHRNYAEYFLNKGDLTTRDIDSILARFDRRKATVFDEEYANQQYLFYIDNRIQDDEDINSLKKLFEGRNILIIAPGISINSNRDKILSYIENNNVIVISCNFTPENFPVDYTFCSNNKRFHSRVDVHSKTIITSNVYTEKASFRIDYNSLSGSFYQGCNSLIMLLKLLIRLNVAQIILAGADGYDKEKDNYFLSSMRSSIVHDNKFNIAVAKAIKNLGIKVVYLTPSAYDIQV